MAAAEGASGGLLAFQEDIVESLESEDRRGGLAVMAMGLGARNIVQELVRIHSKETKIVFVLNVTENELDTINRELKRQGSNCHLQAITSDISVSDRQKLFLAGGCFSVTNRIAIVDLLNDLIPVDLISGLIIDKAHRVRDNSTEAFIIRVYKSKSKGFIKAISDDPKRFVHGFSKLEKAMRTLMITKLTLFPRFHVDVDKDLSEYPPEIVELYPPMTSHMVKIQTAIGEVITACFAELKSKNRSALTDITPEDCLFRNLEYKVRSALLPVFDRISNHSKALVRDLGTLSDLLDKLLSLDSVEFHLHLLQLRQAKSSGMGRSVWMLTKSADDLFRLARERVYKTLPCNGPLSTLYKRLKEKGGVTPVLEDNPKWRLLIDVIEEISRDLDKMKDSNATPPAPRALVIVKDSATYATLWRYLGDPEGYLQDKWRHFLRRHHRTRKKFVFDSKKSYPPKEKRIISQRLGLDAAADELFGRMGRKRKKDREREGSKKKKTAASEAKTTSLSSKNGKTSDKNSTKNTKQPETRFSLEVPNPNEVVRLKGFQESPSVVIYPMEGADAALNAFEPGFIIAFDPDIRLVRMVEVYRNTLSSPPPPPKPPKSPNIHPEKSETSSKISENSGLTETQKQARPPVKLYFLAHAESVETQRYATTVNRERSAFETLIQQKSGLAVLLPEPTLEPIGPVDDTDKVLGSASAAFTGPQAMLSSLDYDVGLEKRNKITRRAGGAGIEAKKPRVIVDVREFRSGLPFCLFQKGMEVVPVTLEVGDYILSPGIAIERKSPADLKGGLTSGRLHRQLQALCRSYTRPILLIEFPRTGTFGFRESSAIRDGKDISFQDVTSKLALVCLHFPSVRLIWSKGPDFTAQIFERLKKNEPEPVVNDAMAVGTDRDVTGEADADVPREMLLQIPGITVHNVRKVMNNVNNLLEMSRMTKEDMTELIGSAASKKAYAFLHEDIDMK
ncbi:hypothetical protein AAMO2058_000130700 [Amorphochlora amoebiformis]